MSAASVDGGCSWQWGFEFEAGGDERRRHGRIATLQAARSGDDGVFTHGCFTQSTWWSFSTLGRVWGICRDRAVRPGWARRTEARTSDGRSS